MSHSPNPDRPTMNLQTEKYLSYRLTVDHLNVDKVVDLVRKYASEYLIWPHRGDAEVPNPHFHIIIPTEDSLLADRLLKCARVTFGGSGNGFHSRQYRDNGIKSAIAYCKHDVSGTPIYVGSYWEELIDNTEPIADQRAAIRGAGKQPRERLGDFVLTYSNLLKQCMKHRGSEKSLVRVLVHLKNLGWIPSRELLSNGVPEEFYDLWDQRLGLAPKESQEMWMHPHQRSEKKKEWQDVPCFSRYNN